MGDAEFAHLLRLGALPATQPYQAVMEGEPGRAYAEKYLNGKKWVDTMPTTVVEFALPVALVARLMAMQCKAEDGCMSMGLGDKAGNGLPLVNAVLHAARHRDAAGHDHAWLWSESLRRGVPADGRLSPPVAVLPGWRVVKVKRMAKARN
jgi:hypothetical protein